MRVLLLPKEYIKEVRREKILRSAVVMLGIINAVLLAGIIFLLPSYFKLTLSQEEVTRRLQIQQESFALQNVQETEEEILRANTLSTLYQQNESRRRSVAPILIDFAFVDSPLVALRAMRLFGGNDGEFVVSLQGNATTRGAFLTYVDRLEHADGVTVVRSPVSNLLSETDISFELEAALNKEFYSYVKDP